MDVRVLRLIIALVLVVFILIGPTPSTLAAGNKLPDTASSPQELIEAVNDLGVSYGLAPYSTDPLLMAVAQAHADFMAITGNVSHTGAGGSSVTDRLLSLGYPLAGDLSLGGFRSENITSGGESMTAQDAVNRWKGDALHLTTMISLDLTEVGAGATVHNGRVYYVIDAARPTDSRATQIMSTTVSGDLSGPTLPPGVSGVIIPVVVVTPNADGDLIHEVKAGQTLWQLAISYGTKIDEIKRLNNLSDNEIYPGARLLIKKGVFPLTNAPTGSVTVPEASSPTASPSFTLALQTTVSTFAVQHQNTPVDAPAGTLLVAMGIIAAAILGGGIVVWWGAKKNQA